MKPLLIGLLLVLVLLNYALWLGDKSAVDLWRMHRVAGEAQQANTALRERNEKLSAEVADLKTGLDVIEERARTDLGMIKKDETFYRVIPE